VDQMCSDLKKFGAGKETESYGFNMAWYHFPEEDSAIPLTLDHLGSVRLLGFPARIIPGLVVYSLFSIGPEAFLAWIGRER